MTDDVMCLLVRGRQLAARVLCAVHLWCWPAWLYRLRVELGPWQKREEVPFALSSSVQWSDLSVTFVLALVMNQTGGRP